MSWKRILGPGLAAGLLAAIAPLASRQAELRAAGCDVAEAARSAGAGQQHPCREDDPGASLPATLAGVPSAPARAAEAAAVPRAPIVSLAATTATDIDRGRCLTIRAAFNAGYECGALRMTHPLPEVVVRGADRAPVLLYSSDHAHLQPAVGADVTLPADGTPPDAVTARLYVDGVLNKTSTYAGSEWSPGETRRITLSYADPSISTGVHATRMEVSFSYGAEQHTHAATGTLPVVNRGNGIFGRGWWIAGFEQLVIRPDTLYWVGGDGSLRTFLKVRTDVWAAAGMDRPDTIRKGPSYGYVRELPAGAHVRFDDAGRHVETVNRLGQKTEFFYTANPPTGTRLDSIRTDGLSAPVTTHRFTYTVVQTTFGQAYRLQSVRSSGATDGAPDRATTFAYMGATDWRVASITDPDGTSVLFSYHATYTSAVNARTNRRGTVVQYGYDPAARLASTTITGGVRGGLKIIWGYFAQESRGHTQSAAAAEVYTRLRGPQGSSDTTAFFVDRWGAPRRIRNALGQVTELFREDARFPALVTRVTQPGGRTTSAAYNARGNLDSVVIHDPLEDGRNAVTRYRYRNTQWPDLVTTRVGPEGDSSVVAYDTRGLRMWQHDGGGYGRRVEFFHNAAGLATSVRTAEQRKEELFTPGLGRDSLEYDALGNVVRARTPLGFWTETYRDRVGRDTLVRSPIDAQQLYWQTQRTVYDAAGRVEREEVAGPALPYGDGTGRTSPAEKSLTRNYFDAEGALDSIARWSEPDINGIGRVTTSYGYDVAGRRIAETAPGGGTDSTYYDASGNIVAFRSRRGHRITMQYDELNRLVRRETPAVTYADTTSNGWTFPRFPTCGTDYCIPAAVATFTYDEAGNLRTADNPDARVSRTYYRGGALKADTLRIRTVSGNDFSQHVYGLRFEYDRNGRRTSLRHPQQLAVIYPEDPDQTLYDRSNYTYDPHTGQLATVTDILGNPFRFVYDSDSRLDSIVYPGQVTEKRTYDRDGRLVRRVEAAGLRVGMPDGFSNTVFRDERRVLDARGKALRIYQQGDSLVNVFSGLGALVSSYAAQYNLGAPFAWNRNEWRMDALGNVQRTYVETYGDDPYGNPQWYDIFVTRHTFQPGTQRLTAAADSSYGGTTSHRFDPSGNQYFTARTVRHNGGTVVDQVRTASYYAADGQLRAVDTYDDYELFNPTTNPANNTIAPGSYNRFFEEYRYDALGRRVFRRARNGPGCSTDAPAECRSTITRVVWDGDQILYEMEYPGGDNVTAADLERDVAVLGGVEGRFHGRVAYLHALGMDAPVAVTRVGYTWTGGFQFPAFTLVPHYNWQQIADAQSFVNGAARFCIQIPGGGSQYCAEASLPRSKVRWGGRTFSRAPPKPTNWFGSLLWQQRDASGQQYMRNRYYDPQTGRFTQEDPLGIAGGLNAYGYANGDPTSFSDPYGLKAEARACEPACTALDALLLAADLADIQQNGLNVSNGVGVVLGTLCTALPLVTGCGAADEAVEGLARGTRALLGRPRMIKHHIFNVFRGNSPGSAKYREFFRSRNIRVDDFTVEMTEGMHQRWIHGRGRNWTNRWKEWIDANPNATAREVYQQAGRMMEEYGIADLPIIPYR